MCLKLDGRLAVTEGFDDEAIRVTTPGGAHHLLALNGTWRRAAVNHSIGWTEENR